MPNSIAEMLQQAEAVVDDLNNNKQDMVVRAVFKIRWRTRQDSALLLVEDHLSEENCENLSPA